MPFYTPCSQQRLQDIIYRRPMLPGFGIHLHDGQTSVEVGTGQMSAAGLQAVLNVQVRAARHRAGLACMGSCVHRALERIVIKSF